jgi:hypothetical protein
MVPYQLRILDFGFRIIKPKPAVLRRTPPLARDDASILNISACLVRLEPNTF